MSDFPQIPGCKILSILGEGLMATVYLGIQEKMLREVAVKVLNPALLKNEVPVARFEREAKASANLSNANIVPIYDYGRSGNYHYIIMERLEESLRDRLNRDPGGKIPPENAIVIVKKIMNALDYAHIKGVVHRDIKPENIMFRQDNTPVLVDFGFAHIFDPSMNLTKSGTVMGTVYYMSPEQCKGKKDIDGRSDIYSLGAVLFEMLTGRKPYEGDSQARVALQQIEAPVPLLPLELRHYQPLIDQMMAKDRTKRLSIGAQFIRVLNSIQANPASLSVEMAEPPAPDIKRRLKHYWNSIINWIKSFKEKCSERLGLFRKALKEKLELFIKKAIEKADTITNKPMVKRVVLIILPGMVVSVLFLLAILAAGSKHTAPPPETSISFNEVLNKINGYFQKVRQAQKLFEKGDLKSLRQAMGIIARLKKILASKGLDDLEDKVTNRINMLNQEYQGYLDQALEYYQKSDYAKAAEYNLKAKQINPDAKDVQKLDELIKKAAKQI